MKQMIDRAGWILAAVLALGVIAFAAREVAGGPLDPPGAPTSTMQTLDNIPGSWDRHLNASNGSGNGCDSDRFKCVLYRLPCQQCAFFADGVLDLGTGLVWQRDTNVTASGTWPAAVEECLKYRGGDLSGWRLPTAAELMSLLDTSRVNPNSSLPQGHPFVDVLSSFGFFWTATDKSDDSSQAYAVTFLGFEPGLPGQLNPLLKTGSTIGAWCVRGAVTQ